MGKNQPRKQMTRPPLERMQRIFRIIKEGKCPSRFALAQEIEVTTKTIQRDIDFMRERLHLPIAHNRQKNGYEFTASVEAFPMLELNSAELISVFVAQKALGQFKGTPFEAPLRSAFEKLTAGLKGSISVSWNELDSLISFRSFDFAATDLAVFQTVSEAVQKHQILEFEYRKLTSPTPEKRRVEPLHLACILNQWYCFAHDLKRQAVRAFVLSRMRNPVMTNVKIAKPRPFSIDDYLKNSFRVFNAKGNHKIRIRFDAFASQLIRERTWHPSQQLRELANGEIELLLRLSSLEEIEPWVLSWGTHAEIGEPISLRERILQIARYQLTCLDTTN